jgi:hypothetical protein
MTEKDKGSKGKGKPIRQRQSELNAKARLLGVLGILD